MHSAPAHVAPLRHNPAMELLILLLILIVVGALLGGDSFGECLRIGCGCLIMAILAVAVLLALGWLVL